MLKEAARGEATKHDEVIAGQVRYNEEDKYYALVVGGDSEGFNAIALYSVENRIFHEFKEVFDGYVSDRDIRWLFPIVVEAELTIIN